MDVSDAACTVNRERAVRVRPADDALVVLVEAAEPSLYLIPFAQFVLRAAVALAARVDWFDVFSFEPSVPVPVFVPMCEIRCLEAAISIIFRTPSQA